MDVSAEAADLVVKEGIQATESAVKLAGSALKNVAALLLALKRQDNKVVGQTNAKRLARDPAPAVVIPLKREDMGQFKKLAKEYARFAKMSQRYEAEQGENAKKIKALRLELKKSEGRRMDVDTFLETVRRYTNATEITQRMVAELIDHIDVYHAEKKDGVTTQRITIYYNCIGAFAVPGRRNIPDVEITMGTRKGVAVSYSPERIA